MNEYDEMQYGAYPVTPLNPGHNTEGSLRYQLEFEDIIDNIIYSLVAKKPQLNNNTGELEYVSIEGGEPLLNEKGLSRLKLVLRANLSRLAPLSELDEEEIRNISKEIEINIRNTINDNWEEFSIIDESGATTIRSTLGTAAFINLKKSQGGRFLRHLRSTHHISEVNQNTHSPQRREKDSLFDKIFGKK